MVSTGTRTIVLVSLGVLLLASEYAAQQIQQMSQVQQFQMQDSFNQVGDQVEAGDLAYQIATLLKGLTGDNAYVNSLLVTVTSYLCQLLNGGSDDGDDGDDDDSGDDDSSTDGPDDDGDDGDDDGGDLTGTGDMNSNVLGDDMPGLSGLFDSLF